MNSLAQTRMNDELEALLKVLGTVLASIAGSFIALRRWLSRDAVGRAGDQADITTIARLQTLLDEERSARLEAERRADTFARERNDAVAMLGRLEERVTSLSNEVAALRGQLSRYTQDSRS